MDISRHSNYIHNLSEIVSDLFDLAITIVDRKFVRVAGTGIYKDSIGSTVENPNVFRYVMEKDKSVLIKDPRKDPACIECLNKSGCKKTTAIYTPLKVENIVVGGMAIVAFNQEQKNTILKNTRFFQFIEQLSDLISGKLEAEQSALKLEAKQSALKLEKSLEKDIAILNAVHDGVIAIDRYTQPITFDNIVGQSPAIKAVKEFSKQVAIGDSTVLIRSESGTGKELFARAIHNESLRSNGPFIAVNCAAIPEPLLESELFGYVEGAFTGARKGGKPGKCELAAGGTLFLDEVGDIPLSLQSKFLRMLQERTIERVGGTKTIPIDVRIIAATHRNLEAMIISKEFREDLYYRINVIPIVLPPLRERKEDIYGISTHFLSKYAMRMKKNITDISLEAIQALVDYSWPGNIRELENSIEYAVNVETTGIIGIESLPQRIKTNAEALALTNENPKKIFGIIKDVETREVVAAVNRFGWTTTGKQAAADFLGISLATLYRKLKKTGNRVGN
jgi:transcriptional regulator with PAS, ATPase and Fis domain